MVAYRGKLALRPAERGAAAVGQGKGVADTIGDLLT